MGRGGMFKPAMQLAVAFATVLAGALHAPAGDYLRYCIKTSGDPIFPNGYFYGYKSSSTGPGDDAFEKCVEYARQKQMPLVILWGKDNCSVCNALANSISDNSNTATMALGHNRNVNAYFRGLDSGSGPKACKDARDFFDTHLGGAKGACHLLGYYGVYPDGTIYVQSSVAGGNINALAQQINAWTKNYEAGIEKHQYRPPASDSMFVAGTNANDRLEAMPGTGSVWVPMARTNNLGIACNEKIVAKYPDGTSSTNVLRWTANAGSSGASVAVSGKWQSGNDIGLILLNTNSESVVTSKISCVSARSNSMTFPYYAGETNTLAAAGWSMDAGFVAESASIVAGLRESRDAALNEYASASNALAAAIAEYTAATNALASAESYATEKYSAFTNAQTVCDSATNEYAAASNALAAAIIEYDTATNSLASAESAADGAFSAFTNAQAVCAVSASAALETAYANLKSAESNMFLVVSGSVVADGRMAKLAEFFATDEYKAWALANKVRNIVLDCPENPETWQGASLLTYDKASVTGASGAYYLSCKGLDPAPAEVLSKAALAWYRLFREEAGQDATAPQIVLVRADGTVFAHVPAYSTQAGVFETAENIARLTEALMLGNEKAEAGNDGIETELKLEWNKKSGTQTLQLSDAADCFALEGFPAQTALKFTLAADGKSPALTVVDKSGIAVEPQFKGGIYVFTPAQLAAGLFARVESGIDAAAQHGGNTSFEYTLSAESAPSDSGTAGFVASSVSIKEGGAEITNGVYKMSLSRTGYTGAVKVSVSLNRELTTAESAAFGWAPETRFVEWANLECGAKTLDLSLPDDETWLGDGEIVFDLAVVDGQAQAGIVRFTVSYQDNDPAKEGVLLIDSVVHPGRSGDGKYYAKAGDTIKIDVRRRDGSKGVADGMLVAKAGGKAFATNCLHWAEKDSVPVKQAAIELPAELFTGARTEAVVTLSASNGFKVVSAASTVKIQVLAAASPSFERESAVFSGTQHTAFSNEVALAGAVEGSTLLRVEKLSGSLPSGLKASLDAEGGKLVISGTPTAATTAKSTYRAVLKTAESTIYSLPVDVTIGITALADKIAGFDTARTYAGIPAIAFDGVTNRLCGMVDLTVSAKGKTSVRYRKAGGKSVSFSAPALGEVEIDNVGNPYVMVSAESKASGPGYSLGVVFSNDGSITGGIADPELENGPAAFSVPAGFRPWSMDNPATGYKGNATLALPLADAENMHANTLCTGAAALRLKFDTASALRTGKVTFAGTLANGENVSGTALLARSPGSGGRMLLAVFSSSSADTLSALLEIDEKSVPVASGMAVPFWSHEEKNVPQASYTNNLSVFCAAYDKTADGNASRYIFKTDGAEREFTLNKTSGIAAGSYKTEDGGKIFPAKWKAVALPGAETGTVSGAYWYSVPFEYKDSAAGAVRKRSVRKGGAVLSE